MQIHGIWSYHALDAVGMDVSRSPFIPKFRFVSGRLAKIRRHEIRHMPFNQFKSNSIDIFDSRNLIFGLMLSHHTIQKNKHAREY